MHSNCMTKLPTPMPDKTSPKTPPMKPSDEATAEQLELAKEQGRTLRKALDHMTQDVAHDGGVTHAGEFLVAYAVEEAEGMWKPSGDELAWDYPDEENVHVEVAVCDAADGRFVPGLEVHATLSTGDGEKIGTHRQPFVWHPWIHHYGRNWVVPGDGTYTLHVRIEPPTYPRHDHENGQRFAEPVAVTFENIEIETGQD